MKKYIILLLCLQISYIFAKEFSIEEFTDTLKYDWKTPQQRIEFRQELNIKYQVFTEYDKKKIDYSNTIFKSALLPGLGHFAAKSYLRGQIIMGSEIILLGAAYFMYDKAMTNFDKYERQTQIDEIKSYYDKASDANKKTMLIMSLYGLVWVYNLYDTILVTDEYNRNLWNKLLENKKGGIRLSPNGISYNF